MTGDVGVIWGGGEEEYFLTASLTGKSLICPAGKSYQSTDRRSRIRHCERSKAIHQARKKEWIASLRSQ
jgi:hypothetical protein